MYRFIHSATFQIKLTAYLFKEIRFFWIEQDKSNVFNVKVLMKNELQLQYGKCYFHSPIESSDSYLGPRYFSVPTENLLIFSIASRKKCQHIKLNGGNR